MPSPNKPRRFSQKIVRALDAARIIGVRSGDGHRYTGVWVVVLSDRAYVRTWNDKPTGWYRAFLDEPRGSIQVEGREVPVRAAQVRSERTRHAVSRAYGVKYPTKGSMKWVQGFGEPEREANTLELLPRLAPQRLRWEPT